MNQCTRCGQAMSGTSYSGRFICAACDIGMPAPQQVIGGISFGPPPLTEADVRRIVREELQAQADLITGLKRGMP